MRRPFFRSPDRDAVVDVFAGDARFFKDVDPADAGDRFFTAPRNDPDDEEEEDPTPALVRRSALISSRGDLGVVRPVRDARRLEVEPAEPGVRAVFAARLPLPMPVREAPSLELDVLPDGDALDAPRAVLLEVLVVVVLLALRAAIRADRASDAVRAGDADFLLLLLLEAGEREDLTARFFRSSPSSLPSLRARPSRPFLEAGEREDLTARFFRSSPSSLPPLSFDFAPRPRTGRAVGDASSSSSTGRSTTSSSSVCASSSTLSNRLEPLIRPTPLASLLPPRSAVPRASSASCISPGEPSARTSKAMEGGGPPSPSFPSSPSTVCGGGRGNDGGGDDAEERRLADGIGDDPETRRLLCPGCAALPGGDAAFEMACSVSCSLCAASGDVAQPPMDPFDARRLMAWI